MSKNCNWSHSPTMWRARCGWLANVDDSINRFYKYIFKYFAPWELQLFARDLEYATMEMSTTTTMIKQHTHTGTHTGNSSIAVQKSRSERPTNFSQNKKVFAPLLFILAKLCCTHALPKLCCAECMSQSKIQSMRQNTQEATSAIIEITSKEFRFYTMLDIV